MPVHDTKTHRKKERSLGMIITAITQNISPCAPAPAHLCRPGTTKSLQNTVINPETDFSLARMDKKMRNTTTSSCRTALLLLRPKSQWNGIFPIVDRCIHYNSTFTFNENRDLTHTKSANSWIQFIKTERYGIDQLGGTLIESTQLMRSKEPQLERGGRIQMAQSTKSSWYSRMAVVNEKQSNHRVCLRCKMENEDVSRHHCGPNPVFFLHSCVISSLSRARYVCSAPSN